MGHFRYVSLPWCPLWNWKTIRSPSFGSRYRGGILGTLPHFQCQPSHGPFPSNSCWPAVGGMTMTMLQQVVEHCAIPFGESVWALFQLASERWFTDPDNVRQFSRARWKNRVSTVSTPQRFRSISMVERFVWQLAVEVGSQSISPLFWALRIGRRIREI